jgi:hypothetical protein
MRAAILLLISLLLTTAGCLLPKSRIASMSTKDAADSDGAMETASSTRRDEGAGYDAGPIADAAGGAAGSYERDGGPRDAGARAGSPVGAAGSGAPGTQSSPRAAPTGAAGGTTPPSSAPVATGPFSCGRRSTKSTAELYAAAASALLPQALGSMVPCAFGSCHNDGEKSAGLSLTFGLDLSSLGMRSSCEAPNLTLIELGGGDASLRKSWLYLKLVAPIDGSAHLIPDVTWGSPKVCGQMREASYGVRMPLSSGADGIGEAKLAMIKEWICAGALSPP